MTDSDPGKREDVKDGECKNVSRRLVAIEVFDRDSLEELARRCRAPVKHLTPHELAALASGEYVAGSESQLWWIVETEGATATFAIASLDEAELTALAGEPNIGVVIAFGSHARWMILPENRQSFLKACGELDLAKFEVLKEVPEDTGPESWVAPGPFDLVAARLTPEELLMILDRARWLRAELDSDSVHVLDLGWGK